MILQFSNFSEIFADTLYTPGDLFETSLPLVGWPGSDRRPLIAEWYDGGGGRPPLLSSGGFRYWKIELCEFGWGRILASFCDFESSWPRNSSLIGRWARFEATWPRDWSFESGVISDRLVILFVTNNCLFGNDSAFDFPEFCIFGIGSTAATFVYNWPEADCAARFFEIRSARSRILRSSSALSSCFFRNNSRWTLTFILSLRIIILKFS